MSAAPAAPARARRPAWQVAASAVGELLVTAGVLVLLFVVWQLFWTDLTSGRAHQQAVEELQRSWQAVPAAPAPPAAPGDPPAPGPEATDAPGPPGTGAPTAPAPGTSAPGPAPSRAVDTAPPSGRAFAILHVPRFGDGYAVPVVAGTGAQALKNGVGHYDGTARPGEVGNFALAGHRVTYGRPFHLIAELRDGDPVVVATATEWFTYRVTGREIVAPSAVRVIAPVPNRPGERPTERLLTMTACHPINSARQRYVVFAELVEVRPRAEGPPDVLR